MLTVSLLVKATVQSDSSVIKVSSWDDLSVVKILDPDLEPELPKVAVLEEMSVSNVFMKLIFPLYRWISILYILVISIAVPGSGNTGNVGSAMKSAKPVNWSTVTPNKQTTRWTPSPSSTRRAPWYIKDKTPWNSVYNRVTPEIRSTTVAPTTEKPTTQPIRATPPITTAKPVNPWAKLWTTTKAPKSNVNVTVLQAGSVRTLQDGQMEMVGAITLINDGGMRVLVDTGSAADTERLLQSMFNFFQKYIFNLFFEHFLYFFGENLFGQFVLLLPKDGRKLI